MAYGVPLALSRACEVIEIPSGVKRILAAGTPVRIQQSLGGSYTVTANDGYMYRVDARDADALGLPAPAQAAMAAGGSPAKLSEQLVRDELKTVYDPEIPVNIVDLGLVYSCVLSPLEAGGNRIDIKMSMTAPGCGMGNVIKADVESKLSRLPEVQEVQVEIVFDPPWTPGLMSESAKLQLGFDLDFGESPSNLRVFR